MYLLRDTDEERGRPPPRRLDGLGDSLLVVGGPTCGTSTSTSTTWAPPSRPGIDAGRPYRVRVTHFAGPGRPPGSPPATGWPSWRARPGPGLAAVFAEAGAVVVPSGPGGRASAGQLLDAVRAAARPRGHPAAQRRRHRDGRRGRRPRRRAGRHRRCTSSAPAPRCRAWPRSRSSTPRPARRATPSQMSARRARPPGTAPWPSPAKQALTSAGPCEPGDVLGAVGGDVVIVGPRPRRGRRRGRRRGCSSSGGELRHPRRRRRRAVPAWATGSRPASRAAAGTSR